MREDNFYTDDFEQMLKVKADEFRMHPSKRVWRSIYNDIRPGKKWPSIAMSMVLVMVLLMVGHFNTSDNEVNNGVSAVINDQNQNTASAISSAVSSVNNIPFYSSNGIHQNNQTTNNDVVTPGENEIAGNVVAKNSIDNAISSNSEITNNSSVKEELSVTAIIKKTPSIIAEIDFYINSQQLYTDAAVKNSELMAVTEKAISNAATNGNSNTNLIAGQSFIVEQKTVGKEVNDISIEAKTVNLTPANNNNRLDNSTEINSAQSSVVEKDINLSVENDKNGISTVDQLVLTGNSTLSGNDERAWIEAFAMQNKNRRNKWKERTDIEFYFTPSVNYRFLSTQTKGSISPFATSDINEAVSQKPGIGVETGVNLSYAVAKKLRIKGGIQFNFSSYGIDADQTYHPVLSSMLMNDLSTGYSYIAARSSGFANAHNGTALQPVTIDNHTFQVSVPVGLAYKLTGNSKVEWFAGAAIQPTYVFGGNAFLISSDLKDYINEREAIRHFNLNTAIESYVNVKLGTLILHAGPQLRYQLMSTYQNKYALIEKPYAVGFKLGLVKGL